MNNQNICPIDKPKKFKGGLVGLVGGLIASLCCITPVVLIFLGLGSVSFAFSFIAFKPYFLIASILFLIITFFIYIKRKKCSVRSALKSRFIWTALLAYIVLFIGSIYFLVHHNNCISKKFAILSGISIIMMILRRFIYIYMYVYVYIP